ncbi:hypothetical protein KIPB_014976, partial [Kipferlia bialata]|eukprot:g14976.t1
MSNPTLTAIKLKAEIQRRRAKREETNAANSLSAEEKREKHGEKLEQEDQ